MATIRWTRNRYEDTYEWGNRAQVRSSGSVPPRLWYVDVYYPDWDRPAIHAGCYTNAAIRTLEAAKTMAERVWTALDTKDKR